jgi:ATP-dependent HslUV protease subunit HslV
MSDPSHLTAAALHGTTILAVRRNGQAAIAGDGQVTLGSTIVKHGAKKIRRLYSGEVLAGFAGSTADAMALFAKFESKIEEYRGNLERAAVELAKDWRTDRMLRRLEAFLVVANRDAAFLLSGAGDVISPDDGLVAVGSGGPFALAAARALVAHTQLDAKGLALEAMKIAASICIYTNTEIAVESL